MSKIRSTGLTFWAVLFAFFLLSCAAKDAPPESPTSAPVTVTEPTPPIAVESQPQPLDTELPDGWEEFVTRDVYFDKNSAALRPAAEEILDEKAAWLLAHPDVRIVIQGNSDEDGTDEYNIALGDRRAGAVTSYLIGRGVAIDRLAVVSNGRETPVVAGRDEASRAKNRRVHFSIDVVD
jgi:peptidoglycan-associated lipoprotein